MVSVTLRESALLSSLVYMLRMWDEHHKKDCDCPESLPPGIPTLLCGVCYSRATASKALREVANELGCDESEVFKRLSDYCAQQPGSIFAR